MAEIQQFDLGRLLSQAEQIKAQRAANEQRAQMAPFALEEAQNASNQARLSRGQQFAGLAVRMLGSDPQMQSQRWGTVRSAMARLGADVSGIPEQYSPEAYDMVSGLAQGISPEQRRQQLAGSAVLYRDPATGRIMQGGSLVGPGGIEFQSVPLPEGAEILTRSGMTQQEASELELAKERRKADIDVQKSAQIEEAKAAVAKRVAQLGQVGKLSDAQGIYDELATADLDLIYGRGESLWPEIMRTQGGIDLMARRDQFVGMLELGARGELKGQGTITDSEAKTLSRSATILSNPNISPAAARRALDDAMNILRRNAGVQTASSTGPTNPVPPTPAGQPALPGEVRTQPSQIGRFRVEVQ
jgi:hypothetical protein